MATDISPPESCPTLPERPPTPAEPKRDLKQICLMILTVMAVIYTLAIAQVVLVPVVIAIMLDFLFSPLVRKLRMHRIPTSLSAAIVVVGLTFLVLFATYKLVTPAMAWIEQGPTSLRTAEMKLRSLRRPIEAITKASAQVEEMTNMNDDGVLKVQERKPGVASTLLGMTGTVAAGLFTTLVLLFFLLASGDSNLKRGIRILPTRRDKDRMVELARCIEAGISRFLFTFSIINICLGIVQGTAMWLLGMPNPVLWGAMATVFNFVPYAGAMAGAIIVFLVALLSFDSIGHILMVPVVWVIFTSLEGNFITPSIMGRSLSLNPIVIFLSIVFFGWIWGIAGALLAVPLTATFKIVCDHFEALDPVEKLLAS